MAITPYTAGLPKTLRVFRYRIRLIILPATDERRSIRQAWQYFHRIWFPRSFPVLKIIPYLIPTTASKACIHIVINTVAGSNGRSRCFGGSVGAVRIGTDTDAVACFPVHFLNGHLAVSRLGGRGRNHAGEHQGNADAQPKFCAFLSLFRNCSPPLTCHVKRQVFTQILYTGEDPRSLIRLLFMKLLQPAQKNQ